jgi:hypothetical protein
MITMPHEMTSVRARLDDRPGTMVLFVGEGADMLAAELASDWGTEVVSVGSRFAADEEVSAAILLNDGRVFTDLDVLFWPAFRVEVLALLRSAVKRGSAAFVWPGAIEGGVARYSEPGRPDFYEGALGRVLVVRSQPNALPGDLPYTTEWTRP